MLVDTRCEQPVFFASGPRKGIPPPPRPRLSGGECSRGQDRPRNELRSLKALPWPRPRRAETIHLLSGLSSMGIAPPLLADAGSRPGTGSWSVQDFVKDDGTMTESLCVLAISAPLARCHNSRVVLLRRDVGGAIRRSRASGRRPEGERDGLRSGRPGSVANGRPPAMA
jgi:hypothetical protein